MVGNSSWENLLLVVAGILVSSNGGILLVLVLGDEVLDVLEGLLEFHLVHTLSLVPVEHSLTLVEGVELGGKTGEHVLHGGGVGNEGGGEVRVLGGDVDNGRLDVVGDPLD